MQLLRLVAAVGLLTILAAQMPHAQAPAASLTADASTQLGASRTDEPRITPGSRLTPTAHPPLPATPAQYWFAPDLDAKPTRTRAVTTATANLVKAVTAINEGNHAAALRLIDATTVAGTP